MDLNNLILTFEKATTYNYIELLPDGNYSATLIKIDLIQPEQKDYYILTWHFNYENPDTKKTFTIKKKNHLNSEKSISLLKTELAMLDLNVQDFKICLKQLRDLYGRKFFLELWTDKTNVNNYQSIFVRGINSLMATTSGSVDEIKDLMEGL